MTSISFLKHYSRWVRFDPMSDPNIVLAKVVKSPLLLCACSLIAVRHTNEDLASELAPKLYSCASNLVSAAILTSPQPIEFFQAAVILCLWSTTVDQVPFSIDSWLLSGFAIQHCQASSGLFDENITSPSPTSTSGDQPLLLFNKSNADYWYIWNHLCMVHLQYCVGTNRRPILQPRQIEKCRAIAHSDHDHTAGNYELRMVAEICLYSTLSDHSSYPSKSKAGSGSVNLLKAVAALQDWKKEWGFLLGISFVPIILLPMLITNVIVYRRTTLTIPHNGIPFCPFNHLRSISENENSPR